jgi:hypothetical protein
MTTTTYQPLPYQQKFHDSLSKLRIVTGPPGSGKTSAIVAEAVNMAVAMPKSHGIVVSSSWRHLRDVLNPALLTLLSSRKIKHRGRYAMACVEVEESIIHLYAPSDAGHDPLSGKRLSWAAFDELAFVGLPTWTMIGRKLTPDARRVASIADLDKGWLEYLATGAEIFAATLESNRFLSINMRQNLASHGFTV